MKFAALALSLFLSSTALAQTATIKDIPADEESSTTITVQKGVPKGAPSATSEMLEGAAEVVGDSNVLEKKARESWKKACEDWKKEVKELNKDNHIYVLNCNTAKCEKDGIKYTCKSDATYKMRLKLQQ